MNFKTIGILLRDTLRDWHKDNASHRAAALAFYSLFSLAPVVMIVIAMAGFVIGREATQSAIIERIRGVAGDETATAIRAMIGDSKEAAPLITATVIGLITLLVGATAVFADLQGSLNAIWKATPKAGRRLQGILRKRFLSFLMVLGIGFFLIASFGVSAALSALTRILGYRPALPGYLWPFFHGAMSFVAFTLLFALVYKLLPDAKVNWSDVWIGATVTSLLFTAGKWLIGLYLGSNLLGHIYGRAGSLVAFLIWIYFLAQMFFLGAEFTHVYAEEFGSRIVPSRDAAPPREEARAETENSAAGDITS